MNKMLSTGILTAGGLALGAAALYFLDPQAGKRRLAKTKDQLQSKYNNVSSTLRDSTSDLSNRAKGLAGDLRSKVESKEVTDDVLVKRVSSKLGHYTINPRDISISSLDGHVTLSGLVFPQEISRLERAIRLIPGVKELNSQLELRTDSDQYERLRSERGLATQSSEILQRNWKPATKILTGVAGGALLVVGLYKGGVTGKTLLGLGLPLVTGVFADLPNRQLSDVVGSAKSINVDKSITINAPVEQVFDFWGHFPNFPNFMRNIREVVDLGDGKSHWKVAGPLGTDVNFDAIVTRFEPNQALSWKTVEDSLVQHTGTVMFEEMGPNQTRVNVQMTYTPPAGVVGHAVATLFGANPRREMEEDLNRAKMFIETGKPAHDASQPVSKTSDAQLVETRPIEGATLAPDTSGLFTEQADLTRDADRSAS